MTKLFWVLYYVDEGPILDPRFKEKFPELFEAPLTFKETIPIPKENTYLLVQLENFEIVAIKDKASIDSFIDTKTINDLIVSNKKIISEKNMEKIKTIHEKPEDLVVSNLKWSMLNSTLDLKKYPLLIGPKGCGKCVQKNTYIFTSNGMKPILSLSDNRKIDSFSTLNEKFAVRTENGYKNANEFYYNGFQKTIKLITKNGYEIIGSEVHPILVIDQYGKILFVQLNDLLKRQNDYQVIIQIPNLFPAENYKIEYNFIPKKNNNFYKKNEDRLKRTLPTELTTNFAFLLGAITGDGWCGKIEKGVININLNDKLEHEMVDIYKSIIKSLFNINVVCRGLNTTTASITFSYLALGGLLKEMGFKNSIAGNKEIPHSILSSTKEVQTAFLMGLFETDGYINKNGSRILFYTKSKKMAEQVHLILLNLGILSKKSFTFNKRYDCNYYSIEITSKFRKKFFENIGFMSNFKKERVELGLRLKCFGQQDRLIGTQKICKELIKKLGIAGYHSKYKNEIEQLRCYSLNEKIQPNVTQITHFLNNVETIEEFEEQNYLKNIIKNNFYFDTIKFISENGIDEVMDLAINDIHSFNSNGFVSHNTATAQELAKVRKMKFFPLNCGQILKPKQTLIGQMQVKDGATYFAPSEFLKFFTDDCEEGVLIFLDEISRITPTAANYFMTILDRIQSYVYVEEESKRVFKGKNVVFAAAANFGFEYADTRNLDGAFIDRFIKFLIDYLPKNEEIKLIKSRVPEANEKHISQLVDFATTFRDEKENLKVAISTRQLIDMAEYLPLGYDVKTIFENIFINLFLNGTMDERDTVQKLIDAKI